MRDKQNQMSETVGDPGHVLVRLRQNSSEIYRYITEKDSMRMCIM